MTEQLNDNNNNFFFFFFLITTHSSILAWRIPWADKSSGLQSMESQRVTNTHTKFHWGFLSGAVLKNPPASARDPREVDSIRGSRRSPE